MVVKEKVGRKRYVLFFNGSRRKDEIIKIIKGKYYLVYYIKNFGIIRCKHTEKEKAIELLSEYGFKTIKSSGTIKKLKKYINSSSLDEAK